MVDSEKGIEKNESLILVGMALFAMVVGIVGLSVLQKVSVHNKRICSYLGGMWERKATDTEHRCYTYQEFYK